MNAATPIPAPAERASSRFTSGPAIVLYIAAGKLLWHLASAARYGIFRDAMFYLACSHRLAWGHGEHPPMTVVFAWLARHLFRESPAPVRLRPAIAATSGVLLTGAPPTY